MAVLVHLDDNKYYFKVQEINLKLWTNNNYILQYTLDQITALEINKFLLHSIRGSVYPKDLSIGQ